MGDSSNSRKRERDPKPAEVLVHLAREQASFSLWTSEMGESFASFEVDGVLQNHPVDSRALRGWLRDLSNFPSKNAVEEAVTHLDHLATKEPRLVTAVRIGRTVRARPEDVQQFIEAGGVALGGDGARRPGGARGPA